MDCILASSLVLLGGIAFSAVVGLTTEFVFTARGHKPTNYLAVWRARRQSHKEKVVKQSS